MYLCRIAFTIFLILGFRLSVYYNVAHGGIIYLNSTPLIIGGVSLSPERWGVVFLEWLEKSEIFFLNCSTTTL